MKRKYVAKEMHELCGEKENGFFLRNCVDLCREKWRFFMADKRKKIILELMGSDFYVPMKEKELAVMLQVSKADRTELNRLLN